MKNINLSKSKYCKGIQCNKILWLEEYKSEYREPTTRDSVLETGIQVGELARGIFGEYTNIPFNKKLANMVEQTILEMKKVPNIITEASFNFENNFCSVDILKNDESGLQIYEVKSGTKIEDIYIEDISYQAYILLNLGYKIKSANIIYINNQYERHGDLELNKLFYIEDVTDIVMNKQKEVKRNLDEIDQYMANKQEQKADIGMQCFKPYDCEFWNYCTKDLPKNNIFKIRIMQKNQKMKLYNKGIIQYEDLIKEDVNWKYKQQAEFELYNKEPYIDKNKIQEFLNTLTYPLYFLDFETFQQAIPMYNGTKPYMQMPFQYSLHYIESKNGDLQHKEFLSEADIDPRRQLAEKLIQDIPQNVCVLAYNMSFEKSVIKELAKQFEDLAEHLLNIHDNIKDLMTPFFNRDYYTKEMEGSYSIKYVLPALFPNKPELDYHKLPVVHNGSEAMSIFANLSNYSKEEQEKIRGGLLKYCELDTYAMVKIWEKLAEITR